MPYADDLRRRNRAVASAAVGVVVVMAGLVAVSPIFYDIFSAYLGYGGSISGTRQSRSLDVAGTGRDVTVAFVTNVGGRLDLDFRPERRSLVADIGHPEAVYFDVGNRSSSPVVIRTAFDVTPAWAAPYFFRSVDSFHPIERLAAGERARVPLVFFVDRRILKDKLAKGVGEITLSYTLLMQHGMNDGALAAIGDMRLHAEALDRRLRLKRSATFANDAPSD